MNTELENMKKTKHNITDWLDKNGNPEIESFIEKNLAITERIRLAMEQKGWRAKDLAAAMGKSPSEVSKWLSGMHNLTLKSIIKMEQALDVCLVYTEPEKQYEYVYLGTIKNEEEYRERVQEYRESTEYQEYEIAM